MQLDLHERELCDVAREVHHQVIGVGEFHEALQVAEAGGRRHVEVEPPQHLTLHLQDAVPTVGVVRHVDEVSDLWRVDLFVLGSDEHGGHAEELVVGAADLLDLGEAVDDVDSQKESFRQQLKLHVHLDQPLNQDLPHLSGDVRLVLDAGGRGLIPGFCGLHMALALRSVLSDSLGVVGICLVMGQELFSRHRVVLLLIRLEFPEPRLLVDCATRRLRSSGLGPLFLDARVEHLQFASHQLHIDRGRPRPAGYLQSHLPCQVEGLGL